MAQYNYQHSQQNSTSNQPHNSYNYDYQHGYNHPGNIYNNNLYYNNNYNSSNTTYNFTPSTNMNNLSYPSYSNYNINYNPPTSAYAQSLGQNTACNMILSTTQTSAQNTTNNTVQRTIQDTVHNTTQSAAQSTGQSDANALLDDPSRTPHFWDDCEYVNYVQGADSCSMCDEEVEDDAELQTHLKAQHHVVFFACTTCRTVFGSLNTFRSHECRPIAPEPSLSATQPHPHPPPPPLQDNKRKRAAVDDSNHHYHPVPTKPPTAPEKVRLNCFGAVHVPSQKRARQRPTRGSTQIQDILQWQQSYINVAPQQHDEAGAGELVVRDETEAGTIALTRELLLEARNAPDGLPVEIVKVPASAVVCRICSLLFASSQQLNRHAGFSKTHKKNVDVQRRQEQKALRFDVTGDTSQNAAALGTYRDRSAERRAEHPEGCPLDYQPFDAVTDYVSADTPIEASNVGRKLLESMGWKEGKGLGKNEIGMVNPLIPQKLYRGAGLGTEMNQYELAAADASTYSDYLRNKKLARYAQLSKTIRDPVEPPPS